MASLERFIGDFEGGGEVPATSAELQQILKSKLGSPGVLKRSNTTGAITPLARVVEKEPQAPASPIFHSLDLAKGEHAARRNLSEHMINFESFMIKANQKKDPQSPEQELKMKGAFLEDWESFKSEITDIFKKTQSIDAGKNADYIPQLAKVNPSNYGVAVCTVDNQRFGIGDVEEEFCVQSVSKPITYCLALEQHGEIEVHKHLGREPSGRGFNAYKLNESRLPFNPLINSGAIAACSLIGTKAPLAERFGMIKSAWKRLAGGGKIGFDNATYQSERKTADRNFALGYLLKEAGVFPEGTNLKDTLDLYFQCCSIELTAKTLAVVAATLANGGVCPVTSEQVFSQDIVRNCLSVMYLCGMYDFSGEWAFSVGLPAKSGVSGALMVIIPGIMGICTWSPRLDRYGNSVRGIAFCKTLVQKYNFHIFSKFGSANLKRSPKPTETPEVILIHLCYAAGKGDLEGVKDIIEDKGVDVNMADYDGRTPLHLAAAEGQMEVVKYLLSKGADTSVIDRWGGTPLSDAQRGRFTEVCDVLIAAGAPQQRFRGGESYEYSSSNRWAVPF